MPRYTVLLLEVFAWLLVARRVLLIARRILLVARRILLIEVPYIAAYNSSESSTYLPRYTVTVFLKLRVASTPVNVSECLAPYSDWSISNTLTGWTDGLGEVQTLNDNEVGRPLPEVQEGPKEEENEKEENDDGIDEIEEYASPSHSRIFECSEIALE
ncbi:hypothetical protein M513_08141 [Trichuris suis]|uniref:Uncharacterized protein n=1 Tax=Trichuris suis TaxID=68888 RepID=A0A085M163_9BILA|nr:hypothetical protein M513_08141 [Trichuris suis]